MLPYAALKFPETKGLSLEEVGALFGDDVVLDFEHISEEERKALDDRIVNTTDLTHLDLKREGTMEVEKADSSS